MHWWIGGLSCRAPDITKGSKMILARRGLGDPQLLIFFYSTNHGLENRDTLPIFYKRKNSRFYTYYLPLNLCVEMRDAEVPKTNFLTVRLIIKSCHHREKSKTTKSRKKLGRDQGGPPANTFCKPLWSFNFHEAQFPGALANCWNPQLLQGGQSMGSRQFPPWDISQT